MLNYKYIIGVSLLVLAVSAIAWDVEGRDQSVFGRPHFQHTNFVITRSDQSSFSFSSEIADSKSATTTKSGGTQNTYASADEFKNRLKGVEDLPEVADERAAIKASENRLAMQRGQMPENDGSWIRPFAAYVDSTQGTKLAPAANAMPTNADRMAGINSAQDALTKRKNDLAKLIFEGGKQLKSGTETNQVSDLSQRIDKLVQGDNMGAAGGLANSRAAALAAHATSQYDTDKMLVPLANSFNNFDKFQGMMDDKKTPVTRAIFNNMQEELTRAAKAGGGAGGTADAAIVRDQMETLAGEFNAFENKFGKITDMRTQAPQLFAQLQSYKNQLRQDFEQAYVQRTNELRNNFDVSANMLGHPEIAQSSHDKADQLIKARATGGKSLNQVKEAAAAPPAKKGDYPDGAPTASWTPAQLKAFLADHGG